MDHFKDIYAHKAALYHRMILKEDVDGNLLRSIEEITRVENKTILDLGSGTGRIPLLLRGKSTKLIALDLHFSMLGEQKQYHSQGEDFWDLLQADMRSLPFESHKMDMIFAGWSIGHFCSWYPGEWQSQIGRVLQEMQRMAAPQADLLVLETMTTGSLSPAPPTPELAQYYAWLEKEWGFKLTVIQTDYQFTSVDQAVEYTEFFFGSELSDVIRQKGWARLPEWTGIWHKRTNG